MKLYNSLTKRIDSIKPLEGDTIRMYTCGPTVYDSAHIGNLSSYIFADMLKRALKSAGFKVEHVMNFTDVDDKTIKRSQEMYPSEPPIKALHKLTRKYEQQFLQDMKDIGNSTDDIEFVRATNMIPAIQVLISTLYENGFAYIAEDGIYFSIDTYRKSGKIYGQLLNIDSSNTSKERIVNDEYNKESVHDFVLWKKKKENEPSWEFHIDNHNMPGRPGWHIECSAMSTSHLGQPFDIHTGGIDLIFPHHENEIAQSTAGHDDKLYAKVFAHNEHLLVDGKKMSKSLDNFYTLEDIKQKGINPLAFRVMVLQSHYSKQSNFTWDNLESANARLNDLYAFADLRWQPDMNQRLNINLSIKDMTVALQNSLDTPKALSDLTQQLDKITDDSISNSDIKMLNSFLSSVNEFLGLRLLSSTDITPKQKELIHKREQARTSKDWALADKLRNQLKFDGIELKDYPNRSVWSRIQ